MIFIEDECVSCADCVTACPEQCIVESDEQFVIDQSRCTACGDCLPLCPIDVILEA